MISRVLEQLRQFNAREFLSQFISLAFVLCSALVIWKSVSIYTNCQSPIVVVLTGSMIPAFYPGDILFLSLSPEPARLGDIVVYKLEGKEIPIVHRVIRLHNVHNQTNLFEGKEDVNLKMLTKGDNNEYDDRFGIYTKKLQWLHRNHIVGRAKSILPYIGQVTIIMNNYPAVKYVVVGLLILLVLTNKE
ncbi:hypothetical protein FDP41_003159 [Naegleria fowleri]|uniref:Signal peptidase complex catalytic subunit SEC11 n=1 Tax=Naegleria fowleri TaxID=5763 RepID=A0A6A5BLD7_NAEFO|nr:uncharacterized protein FDP41_003159 [Naegleria fowleri]KAF0977837.1 hypothetical protein FDP41_003159 [Naegleria fowleri]CAG4719116.1 unnamed protein product [Naegleria fowleri]